MWLILRSSFSLQFTPPRKKFYYSAVVRIHEKISLHDCTSWISFKSRLTAIRVAIVIHFAICSLRDSQDSALLFYSHYNSSTSQSDPLLYTTRLSVIHFALRQDSSCDLCLVWLAKLALFWNMRHFTIDQANRIEPRFAYLCDMRTFAAHFFSLFTSFANYLLMIRSASHFVHLTIFYSLCDSDHAIIITRFSLSPLCQSLAPLHSCSIHCSSRNSTALLVLLESWSRLTSHCKSFSLQIRVASRPNSL